MSANNSFNSKDSMDINELVALNDDISQDLIEQLQKKVRMDVENLDTTNSEASSVSEFDENDDTTLFEEPHVEVEEQAETSDGGNAGENTFEDTNLPPVDTVNDSEHEMPEVEEVEPAHAETVQEQEPENSDNEIEKITNGNIIERPITPEQKTYNDSLDFLDGNVKYSKYVIYIDPQNVNFIESLTVKERKNLINKILREQDDIGITKHRLRMMQTIIRHVIIAIITVVLAIPFIYYTINASLEATINNYRRSQSNFQTLYKENGKIKDLQPR